MHNEVIDIKYKSSYQIRHCLIAAGGSRFLASVRCNSETYRRLLSPDELGRLPIIETRDLQIDNNVSDDIILCARD